MAEFEFAPKAVIELGRRPGGVCAYGAQYYGKVEGEGARGVVCAQT